MKRNTPLKRSPLKRTGNSLKRSRLKPMSKKRQVESREYAKLRGQFLSERPICEIWLAENGWTQIRLSTPNVDALYRKLHPSMPPSLATRAGLLFWGAPRATEVHHRRKRGKNYLNVSTWMAVSREWHEKVEQNKSWAREKGYLV